MAESALRYLDQIYMAGIGQGPTAPRPQRTRGQEAADMLGAASLPLSAVPIAGDIAGIAADAAMYAAYPEERTLPNYAMSALGALPFFPAAAAVRQAQGAGESALDMSTEARMLRAAEMGLTKDVYHGTHAEDLPEVDMDMVDLGLHVGNPEQATLRLKDLSNPLGGSGRYSGNYRTYANILPLKARIQNSLEMEDVGDWMDSENVLNALYENPAFAGEKNQINEMLEFLNEEKPTYYGGEMDWRDSPENRELLREINSLMQNKGYDSVKYRNQVENMHGAEGSFTEEAQALRSEYSRMLDSIESSIRDRMPQVPDPDDPMAAEKINLYMNARLEDYVTPEEAERIQYLKNKYMQIVDDPNSRLDPSSYIILNPKNARSRFAAFDPANRNSGNLLAGAAGTAIAGSALRTMLPQEQERQPD